MRLSQADGGREVPSPYILTKFLSHVWQVLAKKTYPDNQLPVLQQLQRQISGCSRRIWQTVKHVLCDDSPEGHLPEELEDIEGLETKDLLSYSFRAVHESRCGSPFKTVKVPANRL